MNDIYNLSDEYFSRKDIKEQAISDLARIVAVNSVASAAEGAYPYGKACARALDTATELAHKYGFRVENHEYHCLSVLYGTPGEEDIPEIGIVCHLDVVPAGEGWQKDPFVLRRENGLLIGRGSHDDKGPFIQSLYTLRFLRESGIKLPFNIRLILGSDEEVGGTDLEYFLKVRKPPVFSFTPDSEFPVCIGEKSILGVDIGFGKLPDGIKEISGGTVSNAVPGRAKAVLEGKRRLEPAEGITKAYENGDTAVYAEGKTAHAAMPEAGVNAISKLIAYLLDNGIICEESRPKYELLRDATGEYLGNKLGIAAQNDDFGYVTCVGGVIKTVGGEVIQNFNIRHLPENSHEELIGNINGAIGGLGIKAEAAGHSEGYHVSADDEKIRALTDACESVLGIECKPYTMGGGTYARLFPNMVAFGSGIDSQRHFLGDERGNAHQLEEYISESELFDGMRIYSRALGNLADLFD